MGNSLCGGAPEAQAQLERQLAPQKLGHYTWTCVYGYRGGCLNALRRAEAELGRPPALIEIQRFWNSFIPMLSPFHLFVGLQDLWRNDEILADSTCERFSANPAS